MNDVASRKKRITLLIAALMMALSISFGGVAFAGGHGCKGVARGSRLPMGSATTAVTTATITVTAATIMKAEAGAMPLYLRSFLKV